MPIGLKISIISFVILAAMFYLDRGPKKTNLLLALIGVLSFFSMIGGVILWVWGL